MNATVGDTVVVKITNLLGNQTTGLHFHGVNQIKTPEMDGPSGVTQCPLPPDSSLTYRFMVDSPGTFWCKFWLGLTTCLRLTSEPQTTPTIWDSILMACAAHSSCMTQRTRTKAPTTRSTS